MAPAEPETPGSARLVIFSYLLVLGYALLFSIACLRLNLLFGNAGLVSLGHAAYFGMGAYTGGRIGWGGHAHGERT